MTNTIDKQTHTALYDAWANAANGPLIGTDLCETLHSFGRGGKGMSLDTAIQTADRLVKNGLISISNNTYTITKSGCIALQMRV